MKVNESKSDENRLTYPLKKRQIDLLFSTLAYSAINLLYKSNEKINKDNCNADNC